MIQLLFLLLNYLLNNIDQWLFQHKNNLCKRIPNKILKNKTQFKKGLYHYNNGDWEQTENLSD